MRSRFDNVGLGLILGIGLPIIMLVMFYFSNFTKVPLIYFLKYSLQIAALPKMVSICAIPNLGLFFLFMTKNHYYSARGVVAATFLLTFVVLAMKIFF